MEQQGWTSQITATCHNINEFLIIIFIEKKPESRVYTVWFQVYKFQNQEKLIFADVIHKNVSFGTPYEDRGTWNVSHFHDHLSYFGVSGPYTVVFTLWNLKKLRTYHAYVFHSAHGVSIKYFT